MLLLTIIPTDIVLLRRPVVRMENRISIDYTNTYTPAVLCIMDKV